MSAGMAPVCGLLSTHTRPRLLDRCGVLVLHELLRPKLHQVRLQTLYASSGSGMMRYFKVVDLIDISRKSRNKLGKHVLSAARLYHRFLSTSMMIRTSVLLIVTSLVW